MKLDITTYKDELTERYGSYKAVLQEIETQLSEEEARIGRTCITTSNWLIILNGTRGVRVIQKSEIAGVIRTKWSSRYNSGINANIIRDNGELFAIRIFGNSGWEDIFLYFSKDNPYLLSNNDLITNISGGCVPAHKLIKGRRIDIFNRERNAAKLIVKQYHENKSAGIKAFWASVHFAASVL